LLVPRGKFCYPGTQNHAGDGIAADEAPRTD